MPIAERTGTHPVWRTSYVRGFLLVNQTKYGNEAKYKTIITGDIHHNPLSDPKTHTHKQQLFTAITTVSIRKFNSKTLNPQEIIVKERVKTRKRLTDW